MFTNYLKAAGVNLIRHKSCAFITILGLVLGMTSCILILLYVLDELGYDKWIPEPGTLYRYETLSIDQAGTERLARKSALRAARDLQEFFPEIAAATRLIDYNAVIGNGEREFFETVWFADPTFMEVFRLPLLQGDSATALADKSSILLSARAAEKYFPGGAPLGEVLAMDSGRDFRVSGVFASVPDESHITPEFVVLYDEADPQFNFGYSESWASVEGYTYVRLQADADVNAINERLVEFRQNYPTAPAVPAGAQFSGVIKPTLINVLDIHLDPGGVGNIKPPGSRQMLVTLTLIAALVLLIASFNFVNLSTVRSLARTREVSVRKAIGAANIQLIYQFLCESVLVAVLALAVALSLVEVLLPWFNGVLGRQMTLEFFSRTTVLLALGAVVLGIVSGLYPACRLSAWQPASILRAGHGSPERGSGWVQALLVVVQFAISSTLVITTLVVLMQQLFIADTDPGYASARKLIVRNMDESFARDKRELIAAELAALPGVLGTTYSSATPTDTIGAAFSVGVTAPGHRDDIFSLYPKAVGENFFSLYSIPLTSGRSFSADLRSDSFTWPATGDTEPRYAAAVLNASAVAAAGFASDADALGKNIVMENMQLNVIGVVPDVHFQSLRAAITPNMYILSSEGFAALTLSYAESVDEQVLLGDITQVWESLVPGIPLAFEFLEDNIEAQYAQDRLQFLLIAILASLAVTIACMGLFALAAFSTRQRTREIGIRKIHGALRTDILGMLLVQFSKPIVLANVLAWPFALYAITQYLQGFQYRIEPGPAVFIIAGAGTLLVAWAAISYHVMNVVNTRPASVLRQE
jgi:putative ABC transport system permease protein